MSNSPRLQVVHSVPAYSSTPDIPQESPRFTRHEAIAMGIGTVLGALGTLLVALGTKNLSEQEEETNKSWGIAEIAGFAEQYSRERARDVFSTSHLKYMVHKKDCPSSLLNLEDSTIEQIGMQLSLEREILVDRAFRGFVSEWEARQRHGTDAQPNMEAFIGRLLESCMRNVLMNRATEIASTRAQERTQQTR